MNALKIIVVMGGPSGEHDISLKSGHGVADALQHRGWTVESLVIPREVRVEEAWECTKQALKKAGECVVFIALHGTFGEDGAIQQLCEDLGLAYTGSGPLASQLGMDKVASRHRFEAAGLAVPRWHVLDRLNSLPTLPAGWSYPLVVKPATQGSSLGVSIISRQQDLAAAVAEAARFSTSIILEEFIRGREVTVGILGDEPLPVVEIRPHQPFFDFTAKYTPGSTEYLVPAPLPESVARAAQAMGLAAHRALGCRHLSRADILLRHDTVPVLLEVNTIPGFTPTSLLPKAAACIGLPYDALCERLVLMAIEMFAKSSAAHQHPLVAT